MVRRKSINTSVDKLVSLIEELDEITFRKAAKKLAVPVSTIEEWAKVLDKEDIIDIDYKLANPVMIKKKLSKEDRRREIEDFKTDKNVFSQKVDSAKSYFNELDKKVTVVSKMFQGMDKLIETKVTDIEKELDLLEHEEAKKERLDKKILESKKRTFDKVHAIEEHLEEEKEKIGKSFNSAKAKLKLEESDLNKSKEFLIKLKKEELDLKHKLKEIQETSEKVQREVDSRMKVLSDAEDHIKIILANHQLLKTELEKEHDSLKKMMDENEKQEKVISKIQKEIFKKIENESSRIKAKENEIKGLPQYFRKIIGSRKEIKDTLSLINHEEINLKSDVKRLEKKAKALESKLGEEDYKAEMTELNKEIDNITAKRLFFKKKISKLINLFQK